MTDIKEIKKKLGLDKIRNVRKPPKYAKDDNHLYYVPCYSLPMKWSTIVRKGIDESRIISEVDRAEWVKEWREQREKEKNELQKKMNEELDNTLPF